MDKVIGIYKFKGWLFECYSNGDGWPLKADRTKGARAGERFKKVLKAFNMLTDNEKTVFKQQSLEVRLAGKAGRTREVREKMARLYLDGIKLKDIASEVGINLGQVHTTMRWIRKNDPDLLSVLPMRPRELRRR